MRPLLLKNITLGKYVAKLVVSGLIFGLVGTASAQSFLANKKFSPTDIQANSQTSLTFDLYNTSGNTLSATIADTLPVTTPSGQLWFSPGDLAAAAVTGPPGCTASPASLVLSDYLDAPTNAKAQTLTISGVPVPYVANNTSPVCQVTIPVHSGAVNTDVNLINSVPEGGAYAMNGTIRSDSDAFSATLQVRAPVNPLTVGKGFSPTTVPAGGQSTLTITVKNNQTQTLGNIGFTDTLPIGMTAFGVPAFGGGCGGTATTTTNVGATAVSMAGATIAAGATCTVTVKVQAGTTASGPLRNIIPEGGVGNGDLSNEVAAEGTLNVRNQIKMTKAFMQGASAKTNNLPDPASLYGNTFTTGAAIAVIGQAVPVRVYFSNPTSAPLTNGLLTDNLPTDVVAVASSVGGTCSFSPNLTPALASGTTAVSISGFTVPAANLTTGALGTCYVEFWVRATAYFANTTNTLSTSNLSFTGITSSDIDAATSADLAVPSTNPGPAGAMTVEKIFYDERGRNVTGTSNRLLVGKGEAFWMRLAVYNRVYDANYTNVSVTDTLPPGVKVFLPLTHQIQQNPPATYGNNQPVAASCTLNGSVSVTTGGDGRDSITISGANVPSSAGAASANASLNQGCFYSIKLVSDQAGDYQNTVDANAVSSTEGVTNPSAASARVAVASDLATTKNFSPNQIGAQGGGKTRLTIKFVNDVATAITNLGVVDALPGDSNFGYLNQGSVAANTCGGTVAITPGGASASDTVTLTGGTVAGNDSCQIEVDVTHSGGVKTNYGSITNTIPANAVTNAQNQSNTLPITAILSKVNMGISLVKSFPEGNAFGGRSVPLTLTFSATNGSVQPQDNIRVTDSLPAGMLVAPNPNIATTCKKRDVTATEATVGVAADNTAFTISGFDFSAVGGGQVSCEMVIDVIVTSTGNKTNTIAAAAITTDAGTTNTSPTQATLSSLANTAVHKAFSPKTIKAGETSTLTLTIVNVSTESRTDFTLTDTFPAGLVVAATPAATTTCGDGTLTVAAGSNLVRIDGGDVGANASCTISVGVKSATANTYVNDTSNLSGTDYLDTTEAKDTLVVEEANPVPPTPVPTLSHLAMLVLGLLLAMLAWRQHQVR